MTVWLAIWQHKLLAFTGHTGTPRHRCAWGRLGCKGSGEAAQRLLGGAWYDLQGWGQCHGSASADTGAVLMIQCLLHRLDAAKVPSCVRTCARSLGTPGQNPRSPRPFPAESPVLTRPELLMPLSSIQWHKLLGV